MLRKGCVRAYRSYQQKPVLEPREQVSGTSQIWSRFLPQLTFRRHDGSTYLCQGLQSWVSTAWATYPLHVRLCSPAHPIKKIGHRNQRRNCYWIVVALGHKVCPWAGFRIGTFLENWKPDQNQNPPPYQDPLVSSKVSRLEILPDYHLQNHPSDLWLVRNSLLWQLWQRRWVCPLSWDMLWMNKSQR